MGVDSFREAQDWGAEGAGGGWGVPTLRVEIIRMQQAEEPQLG